MADLKISQLTGATTPLAGTEVVPLVQSSSTKKVAVSDLTAGRAVSGLSFATANVTVGASAVTAGTDISYSVNSGATQKVQAGYTTGSFRPALFMYSVGANHDMVLQFTDLCRFYNAAGATQFSIDHLNSKVTTEYNIIPAAAKGVNFTANTPAAGMTSQLLNWYEEGTWTPSIGGDATYNNRSGYYTRIGRQVTAFFLVQVNVKGTGSADTVSGLPFTVSSSTTIRGGGSIQYFGSLAVSTAWLSPVANSNTTTFSFIGQNAVDDTCLDAIALFQDGTFVIGSIVYFV